jgi:hypothetical protein
MVSAVPKRRARVRLRHPFVLLSSINTGDKHRTIQSLWAFPSRIDTEVTNTRDCAILHRGQWRGKGDPLEVGTELTFLRGRKMGSNPELEVQLKVTTDPSIGNRISLKLWGQYTGIFIFNLLRQFSKQPASIHEVGAELSKM